MEEQAWREVLERLARIETKLDNYETVRDKAERAFNSPIKCKTYRKNGSQ